MKQSIKNDLVDASDALEHIVNALASLTLPEKIDVCARLRAVAKNVEAVDKSIKDEIKKRRKGKDGYVLGEVFKAKLTNVPVTRFDQAAFKEEQPEEFLSYQKDTEEARVTFEPR